MTTLPDFLLARIAEDEAMALHSRGVGGSGWAPGSGGIYWSDSPSGELHIDPARMLADCEAKRRIVELHRLTESSDWRAAQRGEWHRDFPAKRLGCVVCDEDDGWLAGTDGCETVRLLALPYADHADYREAWKP